MFFSLLVLAVAADLPAFPGAEGFGSTTPGGRGGKVLLVTNLNDSGPGSLRAAVEADGPRIVVFRTGGLIELKSHLKVTKPFLTIAGQSAPGDGICLKNGTLLITTHDVVVRYIRSRLGTGGGEADAISVANGSRRVVLDHVSAGWSVDESLSPSGDIQDVTLQWSIISESLNHSIHAKGDHGYGSLVRATGGVSLHHNLWAHHNGRNPRLGDNYGKGEPATYDFRNNVIYDWGSYCSGLTDGHIRVNYVGNFLRHGPSSSKRNPIYMSNDATADTRFYLASNVVDGHPEWTTDNSKMFDHVEFKGRKIVTVESVAFGTPSVRTMSAQQAFEAVLNGAGATKPKRDSVDTRVVESVRKRIGRIINSTDEVGGWPVYQPGAAPVDTDGDGIPDAWESAHGLDPRNPADALKPSPSGHSWIEVYLNELAEK